MPRQACTTVYTFDELSDKAKERARDWWRSCRDASDFEYVIADAVRMGEILGISFATHSVQLMGGSKRQDPSVWWSLGYCQGDGAAFDGTYYYAKQAHAKIRTEAPEDKILHAIADDLLALQRKYRYKLSATIKSRDLWPDVDGEVDGGELSAEDHKALAEIVRTFCKWIYTQLRTEDEYQSADAQVDDNIRANEYEFTAEGSRTTVI